MGKHSNGGGNGGSLLAPRMPPREERTTPARAFAKTLREIISEHGEDPYALRDIARVLIEKCRAGDNEAIKEFANRVDGRVPLPLPDMPAGSIVGRAVVTWMQPGDEGVTIDMTPRSETQ